MPISPYVASLRKRVGKDLLMLPSACAVVVDDNGRVLLGQRADTGSWSLPAGAIDPGEQPADAEPDGRLKGEHSARLQDRGSASTGCSLIGKVVCGPSKINA